MTHAPLPDETAAAVLNYLAQHLPGYPFDQEGDAAFVDELLRNARGAIRAWIRRARR